MKNKVKNNDNNMKKWEKYTNHIVEILFKTEEEVGDGIMTKPWWQETQERNNSDAIHILGPWHYFNMDDNEGSILPMQDFGNILRK